MPCLFPKLTALLKYIALQTVADVLKTVSSPEHNQTPEGLDG